MASQPNDLSQPPQAVEITRDDAIRRLLTDEMLSDLTIRGSDGTLVIANRCLLASRSPVFCRMLFGEFAEASKTTIDLGYDGKILQAVVEYIYTDQVPTLEGKEEEDKNDETPWDITFVRFLVNLVYAAEYFSLPELCRKIEKAADTQMKKNEDVATLVLAVCSPNCNIAKALQGVALEVIKRNPKIIFDTSNKSSLALIHQSHVEEILKDDTLPADEYSCFQFLQSWANADVSKVDCSNAEERDQRNSRRRSAAELTRHIDLTGISAIDLSTTVTSSGLVTAEQLSDAYKAQALRLQQRHRPTFTRWRGGHVWESTRTTIYDKPSFSFSFWKPIQRLECAILKSGVHKWSIKVLKYDKHSPYSPMLGVVSTCWPVDSNNDNNLCDHRGGWGLFRGTAGHALRHDNKIHRSDLPYVSEGSTVSFTLDFEQGGGTLAASIDGGASFQLFSDMCQDHGEGHGFVPAVSGEGRVEFLGFEEAS